MLNISLSPFELFVLRNLRRVVEHEENAMELI